MGEDAHLGKGLAVGRRLVLVDNTKIAGSGHPNAIPELACPFRVPCRSPLLLSLPDKERLSSGTPVVAST